MGTEEHESSLHSKGIWKWRTSTCVVVLYYIVNLSNVEREIKKTNLKENLLINKQLRDIFKRWFTCSFIHVLQVVACPQYLFVNKKVKLNVKWEQGL